MRTFSSILLAFIVTVVVLFFSGIAVCILAIVTSGNMIVIVPSAGLAIAFSFYCGYKVSLAAQITPHSDHEPLIYQSKTYSDVPHANRAPPRQRDNRPEDS
jgi:hypothetical protein